MEKSSGLYRLVYDFYEAQIVFGYYRYGDSLPPIAHICATFHLGRATVRAALAMLEKAGFLRNEERKTARVTYQADDKQYAKNAVAYYAPRTAGLQEFSDAGRLLFLPLWEAGTRRWDKCKWEFYQRHISTILPGGPPPSMELYLLALAGLNNQLILNLYWEAMRYIRIPSLLNREKVKRPITERTIREGLEKGDVVAYLNETIRNLYLPMIDGLFSFLDQESADHGLSPVQPIHFQWNIYRQRPQMRYTLSSLFIREMMYGRYPVASYLPSLPELVQRYGVSLTTVRRTLSLLEALGVTESHQGKGTLVCMKRTYLDLTRSEIRETLRLYRESLQFLALTIRGVALYTLARASRESREALVANLRSVLACRRSYCCFELMLMFIKRECPLAMVRECYGRIAELVAWGYPFARLQLPEGGLNRAYASWVAQMVRQLAQNDLEEFSHTWTSLFAREEQQCANWEKQGVLKGAESTD